MATRRQGRLQGRLRVLPRALLRRARSAGRRARPTQPQRIAIVHHLLLGDTLQITPLLAKCREQHPLAEIVMTVPAGLAGLYAGRPYGVQALPFSPGNAASLTALMRGAPPDLALVPGDNRHAWLAQAMGARWIVAFDGDTPGYKNWMVDEFVPVPAWPWNWGDASALLLPGAAPAAYDPADWPEPPCAAFDPPVAPYAVFHLGARNPLRHWQAPKWRALADWAASRGLHVVWSAGADEQHLVDEVDPDRRHANLAGRLDLAQLWHLVKRAGLVVCPDTGIAHLARLTGAPCVTLFGPGSVELSGAGAYWGRGPTRAVSVADVPCRNQSVVFRRHVPGMQRCVRFAPDCTDNICMQGISIAAVTEAADGVLRQAANRA